MPIHIHIHIHIHIQIHIRIHIHTSTYKSSFTYTYSSVHIHKHTVPYIDILTVVFPVVFLGADASCGFKLILEAISESSDLGIKVVII